MSAVIDETYINSILLSLVSGLVGWVLHDLRRRTVALESKLQAAVVCIFYMVIKDPNIPQEAKEALERAMGIK